MFLVPKATPPIEKARNRGKFQPCPLSNRRKWVFGAARAFRGYGCTIDEAITVIGEQWSGDPTPGTIEEVVSVVFKTEVSGSDGGGVGGHGKPDWDLIARTVDSLPNVTLATLTGSPRNRVSQYQHREILASLWHKQSLICVGETHDKPDVVSLGSLLSDSEPERFQYVVANGMRKRWGKVQGKSYMSKRSSDNACLESSRRWAIIEHDISPTDRNGQETPWKPLLERWLANGITAKDAATRLLCAILKSHKANVAMVVDSAGKSIHAWVPVLGWDEERKAALMSGAVRLGADYRTFILSQWVRFPAGTRRADNGNRPQPIVYYNPDVLPGNEIGSGEGA
jgi:hypothetical protein